MRNVVLGLLVVGTLAAAGVGIYFYRLTAPVEVSQAPPSVSTVPPGDDAAVTPEATPATAPSPDGGDATAPAVPTPAMTAGATVVATAPTSGATSAAEPTAPAEATARRTDAPARPTAAPRVPARVYRIDPAQSRASYRVDEVFLEDSRLNTAEGVSDAVSGEVRVDSGNPAASRVGEIVVDISQFESDSDRRDNAIRRNWLESARYPLARFANARLRNVPTAVTDGKPFRFEMVGDLTVHETTREVSWATTATLDGATLRVDARTRIDMRDFNVDPPDIGGFVKAEPDAELRLQLVLRQRE